MHQTFTTAAFPTMATAEPPRHLIYAAAPVPPPMSAHGQRTLVPPDPTGVYYGSLHSPRLLHTSGYNAGGHEDQFLSGNDPAGGCYTNKTNAKPNAHLMATNGNLIDSQTSQPPQLVPHVFGDGDCAGGGNPYDAGPAVRYAGETTNVVGRIPYAAYPHHRFVPMMRTEPSLSMHYRQPSLEQQHYYESDFQLRPWRLNSTMGPGGSWIPASGGSGQPMGSVRVMSRDLSQQLRNPDGVVLPRSETVAASSCVMDSTGGMRDDLYEETTVPGTVGLKTMACDSGQPNNHNNNNSAGPKAPPLIPEKIALPE